ncbi:MAG: OmpA family protein, partial [Pseudomonadota bacterium]
PGAPSVTLISTTEGIHLQFTDRALFRRGSVGLNPAVFPLLDGIARVLNEANRSVVVRGYADPMRPANYPSNIELSAARAVRVARYLVESGNMPQETVTAEGMGIRTGGGAMRYVELIVPEEALGAPLKTLERKQGTLKEKKN